VKRKKNGEYFDFYIATVLETIAQYIFNEIDKKELLRHIFRLTKETQNNIVDRMGEM